MPASLDSVATGLAPDQPDALVADEGVERADRIRAAAHAGDDRIGQAPGLSLNLLSGLDPDHPLEIADHLGERVRAHHRANAVVGGLHARDPVTESLVDGVLQRLAADRHRDDTGA